MAPNTTASQSPRRKLPHRTVSADRLVLAAGALGTPWLLLRNRATLPALGDAVGTRFSGNGDLLGFAMRAKNPDGSPWILDAAHGPVITSAIRVPDEMDGGDGRGFYIEDAGFPAFVEWMLEAQATPNRARRAAGFAGRWVRSRLSRHFDSDLSAEFSSLVGGADLSASSMPLLGMGRDVPDGRLRLRRGLLDVDWTTETSEEFFNDIRSKMAGIAEALGAEYRDNLLWLLKRVVTVHALGGAPMGRNVSEGVVDAHGEAYGHPGLYVVDGAAMPGPVGPNPALTIAAFADRVAERILESGPAGRTVSPPTPQADPPKPEPEESAVGGTEHGQVSTLEFTEEMKGHVTLGMVDFAEGARRGKEEDSALMFRLTIALDDVAGFVADPSHEGTASGWIECERLGGRLEVDRGVFNLFVDGDDPGLRRMLYRLWFSDSVGNPLTLVGFKTVRDDSGFDVWPDTSTLHVRVLQRPCRWLARHRRSIGRRRRSRWFCTSSWHHRDPDARLRPAAHDLPGVGPRRWFSYRGTLRFRAAVPR